MKLKEIKTGQLFSFYGTDYLKTASIKPITNEVNEVLVVNTSSFATMWASDQVEVTINSVNIIDNTIINECYLKSIIKQ